jgi:hypothetical protein
LFGIHRVVRFGLGEPHKMLAVLIDADNAQTSVVEQLLKEMATFGDVTVNRVYGAIPAPSSSSWKKVVQSFATKPVRQFAHTTGKNATDSSLNIDAMDLLYSRKFDGFCLITSNSGFTSLAMRLREAGLIVLGVGERKAPDAFRNACHRFMFTEVLRENIVEVLIQIEATKPKKTSSILRKAINLEKVDEQQKAAIPRAFFLSALEQASDEFSWAKPFRLKKLLIHFITDFYLLIYGLKNLDLVKANPFFESRKFFGPIKFAMYFRGS